MNFFANYSYQAKPEPEGFDISELNLPAEEPLQRRRRASTYARFLGNLSISYSDDAFWQDVLDDRYHGTTEAYTLVNGGFGVRWAGRPADDVGQGDQPGQPERAAARVRRHPQASGRRGAPRAVLGGRADRQAAKADRETGEAQSTTFCPLFPFPFDLSLLTIRLLALDIDGTILDSHGQIPAANRDAIARAIEAGVEVALATGRRYDFARPIFDTAPRVR